MSYGPSLWCAHHIQMVFVCLLGFLIENSLLAVRGNHLGTTFASVITKLNCLWLEKSTLLLLLLSRKETALPFYIKCDVFMPFHLLTKPSGKATADLFSLVSNAHLYVDCHMMFHLIRLFLTCSFFSNKYKIPVSVHFGFRLAFVQSERALRAENKHIVLTSKEALLWIWRQRAHSLWTSFSSAFKAVEIKPEFSEILYGGICFLGVW